MSIERRRRQDRGAERPARRRVGCGEGVSPSPLEGVWGFLIKFYAHWRFWALGLPWVRPRGGCSRAGSVSWAEREERKTDTAEPQP